MIDTRWIWMVGHRTLTHRTAVRSGHVPDPDRRMDLVPDRPPGRASRRALAHGDEIRRLRRAGYTFDSIRETLLNAGVSVSLSTVQREARRASPPALPSPASNPEVPPTCETAPIDRKVAPAPLPAPAAVGMAVTAIDPKRSITSGRSGKEIAREILDSVSDSPLFRRLERP